MEILLPRSARRWRADALKTPKVSTAIGSKMFGYYYYYNTVRSWYPTDIGLCWTSGQSPPTPGVDACRCPPAGRRSLEWAWLQGRSLQCCQSYVTPPPPLHTDTHLLIDTEKHRSRLYSCKHKAVNREPTVLGKII